MSVEEGSEEHVDSWQTGVVWGNRALYQHHQGSCRPAPTGAVNVSS